MQQLHSLNNLAVKVAFDGDKGAPNPKGGSAVCDCQSYRMKPIVTQKPQIGFGGGCHWCTEAIFASLRGVKRVRQGWIASTLEEAGTFSEAVIVTFDEKTISLETLIEIHLHTHNATSNHVFRKKYRSAIYTFGDAQERKARSTLYQLQKGFDKPLVTRVYPFGRFKENSERYLNYYHKNPHLPFCQTRIEPKLKILFDKYAEYAIVAAKKD